MFFFVVPSRLAGQWHFINMPVIKGPVEFALTAVYPNYNVVWAVNSSFNVLASPASTAFEKVRGSWRVDFCQLQLQLCPRSSSQQPLVLSSRPPPLPSPLQAQVLRFLVHFVGDLHQPLHIMTM